MSDAPDPDDLARRYLDLWQQHLTEAANDPALAAGMAKLAAIFQPAAVSGLPGWPMPAWPGGGDETGTDRTAAAAASSECGGNGLGEFAERLAALEKRLDALERKSGAGRKGASSSTRSRKS